MEQSVPRTRVRSLDNTWNANGAEQAWEYSRHGDDCNRPLAWASYYLQPTSVQCGRKTYMQDMVTPGYHRRSQAGEVIMTPMLKSTVEINPGYGQLGGVWKNNYAACSGAQQYNPIYKMYCDGTLTYGRLLSGFRFNAVDPYGMAIPSPCLHAEADMRSVRTEASTACLANRGNAAEANLWEDLAEFHQTMGLTGNLFTALRTILSDTKDKWVVNGIANVWLMYRYGILLLVSDIKVVAAALQKVSGKRRITSRGLAASQKIAVSPMVGNRYATWSWSGTVQTVETYECRAMSLDEVVVNFANDCGLSLKGLAVLPWNLTQYSFVLDWFLNFGDLFGSVVPAANATQLGSCMVTTTTRRDYFTAQEFHPVNQVAFYMQKKPDDCGCERIETTVRRYVNLENPGLVIRGGDPFRSWRRAADAVALLTQFLVHLK